jgi:hypothetical protein
MSNTSPTHNTTTTVEVRTGAAGAAVDVTAHYKSKDTEKTGKASSSGSANIPFDISTATIGFTVDVDVSVDGGTASCSTSFTPVG